MDENMTSRPSSNVRLPNQKNIIKFFKSFDIAQVVYLQVNQSKFSVNSILLVLHSQVFEDLIYSGAEEITLDDSLQFPGAEVMLHQCLLYLYGKTVNIDLSHIVNIYHFASVYKIPAMQELCEESFMKIVLNVETFIAFLSKWMTIDGRSCSCKALVIKNSMNVVQFLTSSENLSTILKLIRSERYSHDSSSTYNH